MKSPVTFLMSLSLIVGCGSLDTNQNQIANTDTSISLTIPTLNINYDTTVMTLHIREGANLESNREIYRDVQNKVSDSSTYQILAEPGRSYITHITYQMDGEDVASTRFCGALTNIISNVATGINHYNPRICYPSNTNSSDIIRSSQKNDDNRNQTDYDSDKEDENQFDDRYTEGEEVIRSEEPEDNDTYLYEDLSTGEEFVVLPGDGIEHD